MSSNACASPERTRATRMASSGAELVDEASPIGFEEPNEPMEALYESSAPIEPMELRGNARCAHAAPPSRWQPQEPMPWRHRCGAAPLVSDRLSTWVGWKGPTSFYTAIPRSPSLAP